MRNEDELWWESLPMIQGFEDDDTSGDEDSDDEEDDNEENSGSEDESSDDTADDDEDDSEDEDKPDVNGLKSALKKERQQRRALEREVRKLKKKPASQSSDDSEDEDKADPAESSRSVKLAEKIRTQAIDTAIIKAAGSQFKDIDDVLALISRGEIDVDQDDDDPSEVDVDFDSVKEAVKTLAKRKPHLLASKDAGPKSGSKFGGGRKGKGNMSEEELRKKYPALNR